ncbi:MAG: type II secretion system F family protein [Kiritimatiellae bacterium]|nr:type II secretion system F family protein [Kiritimatiellia bacterium]
MIVFGGYVAVSSIAEAPFVRKDASFKNLPGIFRVFYRFINTVAQTSGTVLATSFSSAARQYQNWILMAGFNLTPEIIFGAQVFYSAGSGFIFCTGAFMMTADVSTAVVSGLVAAFLGWVYPSMIVQKAAQTRQKEIIKSLPFAIDLLTSAMRAGLDFIAAVRYYVGMGGGGALAVEFGILLRQMELGKSRVEALNEMATHVQTDEFTAFVGAVAHGTEIGASIIDTLQVQGEDMRRARFNMAEQQAARAPSIMIFPIALFILPAVFIIVITPVVLRYISAKGGA